MKRYGNCNIGFKDETKPQRKGKIRLLLAVSTAQTALAILFYDTNYVNHIVPNVNAIISSTVGTTADLRETQM